MKRTNIILMAIIMLSSIILADSINTVSDGVHYKIILTKKITKPDVFHCERNDLGFPILGIYNQETRRYTKYTNNKVVKTWTEVKEVFKECQNI